tara:strand:- start:125 stop:262 length:138 start_codon:yes stop_codon:yes gene_type:complete
MAHDTVWCEPCEKWVAKAHAEKKHKKTNYLSPSEPEISEKFWNTD